jgi:hypothetical protein
MWDAPVGLRAELNKGGRHAFVGMPNSPKGRSRKGKEKKKEKYPLGSMEEKKKKSFTAISHIPQSLPFGEWIVESYALNFYYNKNIKKKK